MITREEIITKRRIFTSYLTTVVSISLVLFLLGLTFLLVLNAKRISDHIKENFGFTVFLKENAKQADINVLQKNFDATSYVKSTEYISQEKAAEDLKQTLGEDFIEFLGFNPLLASLDVRLYADYANSDSLQSIEKDFLKYPLVSEVSYQKSLLHLVNENVRKISFILLGFSLLLFLIAFALINNTIRLMVYSKRFIINTMKLIGATRAFIQFPFLLKSTIQGIVGALLAILMLILVIYFAQNELKDIISLYDFKILGSLFGIVIVLGVLMCLISTYIAVGKYLKIKSDNLYY
ncbi:MAG: cell division protein FtsX [Bacteroidetes bacterium GWA2_30_7]|nr:MAG: cell division protein FtsX [Bacteroidetes bacterium GWA2_30_7]